MPIPRPTSTAALLAASWPASVARSGPAPALSSTQIRRYWLRDTSFGRRGYRRDDVDLLLDRIAAEVDERDQLIASLRAEVTDLRNHHRAYYGNRGTLAPTAGPAGVPAEPPGASLAAWFGKASVPPMGHTVGRASVDPLPHRERQ